MTDVKGWRARKIKDVDAIPQGLVISGEVYR
jgi:hypothetical protein